MTSWIKSGVSKTGRLTIPRVLRTRLGLKPDGKVLMQEVADGVIILSREPLSSTETAGHLLEGMVKGIGSDAERLGIEEEADLDRLVEVLREQTFAERYGSEPQA